MYLKDYDNVSKDNLKSNFEKANFLLFYSRFQLAFEKSSRMFVCKFRTFVAKSSNVCFEVRSEYLR